jgi:rsbT co-antagonist protein RsbR
MSKISTAQANKLAANILDVVGALVVVLDPQGRIVRFNPVAEKATGYSFEELENEPFWDYLILPEEREGTETAFKQLTAEMFPSQYENYWLTKDGGRRLMAWSNTAILGEQGQVEYVVSTGIDITEQREAEEKLRYLALAVEQAPDGVAIANMEGYLQFANPAWVKMHGYEGDELLGQNLSVCHTEEQMQKDVSAQIDRVMKNGSDQGEVGHKRRDGTPFPTWMSTTLIKDEKGNSFGLVGIARDISEQKEIEAERERLQQQIINAQQLALKELSTPVIPIYKRADVGSILVMPLIGTIDTKRAKDITRRLLAGISEHEASIVILDITGVPIVDTGVADHLNKTVQAARLKGAHTIVTGVADAVAETIVELGVEWEGVQILRNLQTGLITALNWMGVKLDNK